MRLPIRRANYLRSYGSKATTSHDAKEELDDRGIPYNEMDALPWNRQPGVREPTDWTRRIFVVFYMGGIAAFLFLNYYKPDTSVETWAEGEALRRMRERGVDLYWWEEERHRLVAKPNFSLWTMWK